MKRKAKAQAKGWTPQSIEKEFGGRYAQVSVLSNQSGLRLELIEVEESDADHCSFVRRAQIFDGVPTHPVQPFSSEPEMSNNGSAAPPPMSGESQPTGSIPYNVSDHNVPLATRPVSLVSRVVRRVHVEPLADSSFTLRSKL